TRRSRTCPQCGNITAKNRKSQAVFACANCGYSANTDINTVRNVPHSGLVSHDTERYRTQSPTRLSKAPR
ncbi:MAG: transposase, partial [Acidimicrobiaceae bacterium]|nr:transposase [Acidimicrobiaceae bacterium]